MDNPYITSVLTKEIKHMRRRYGIRMWITLGVLMVSIWLVLQIVHNQPREYQTKLDINKINKLNDIAGV